MLHDLILGGKNVDQLIGHVFRMARHKAEAEISVYCAYAVDKLGERAQKVGVVAVGIDVLPEQGLSPLRRRRRGVSPHLSPHREYGFSRALSYKEQCSTNRNYYSRTLC